MAQVIMHNSRIDFRLHLSLVLEQNPGSVGIVVGGKVVISMHVTGQRNFKTGLIGHRSFTPMQYGLSVTGTGVVGAGVVGSAQVMGQSAFTLGSVLQLSFNAWQTGLSIVMILCGAGVVGRGGGGGVRIGSGCFQASEHKLHDNLHFSLT
jgi:hypothetical protein